MAEGLMLIPAESDGFKAGDAVTVQLLQGTDFQTNPDLEVRFCRAGLFSV